MFQIKFSKFVFVLLICALTLSVFAQAKRKPSRKKPVKKAASVQTSTVVADEATTTESKKNARPEAEQNPIDKSGEIEKTNSRPVVLKENKENSVYFYEFSQPNFTISKISIEHDESGKGKITLLKKDFGEPETDPLQLSTATLERVKAAWQVLNFLDSTENYQYEKDYSHLGAMKFTLKKDGREREAKFNWTQNKDAKTLADEYRKIGQQFVWIFDINVARESQPLDAPRLFDSLDSLIRRNEISDANQMIPLLNELGNDERIPLIARNHAAKLVKQIEKKNAEKK